jgi:hypothetical protein
MRTECARHALTGVGGAEALLEPGQLGAAFFLLDKFGADCLALRASPEIWCRGAQWEKRTMIEKKETLGGGKQPNSTSGNDRGSWPGRPRWKHEAIPNVEMCRTRLDNGTGWVDFLG